MKRQRGSTVIINPKRRKTSSAGKVVVVPRRAFGPLRTGGYRGFYGGFGQRRRSTKELKFVDVAAAALGYDTTGSITLMNGVAQGTDYNQRVGRKTTIKSILVRTYVTLGSVAPVAANARFMIVYDAQANGATPAITDIITTVGTTSPQNLNNRDRFRIIWDKIVSVSPNGTQIQYRKLFKKCWLEVINSGTAATIGSIQTGSLFFVTIGDNAAGTAQPIGVVQTRIRFIDD